MANSTIRVELPSCADWARDSPPAEPRRHVFQNSLDRVGVVINAELVRHGQQQSVSLRDCFILSKLLDQHIRLGCVAAAKNGACIIAQESDLILILAAAPEIGAVTFV